MAQRLLADLAADGVTAGFVPVDPSVPRILRPLDQIKYIRTLLRSIYYIFSLLRHVPRHDVIHVFSASYASFLISPAPALLVARLFGKPSILNYRSGEAQDHLQRAGRITKWLLRMATCIVVPSDYLGEVFRQFGFATIRIPNHVEPTLIKYRERREIRPRILISRTLEPLYNIECALRAFQIVQKKHANAELTILGDGSQRDYLTRLASELDLRHVTFAGTVERSEIARYYDEADIFLNTSSIDNMPVSIIEAFAAGLPVVTTDAGGIPYLITDRINGHLLKINDYAGVAERLIELVERPDEMSRLSRAGRNEIRKYRWETAGPKWKSLYRNLRQPTLNNYRATNSESKSLV
jgi:glycosyltransferase involved in cell wall biosynthesis